MKINIKNIHSPCQLCMTHSHFYSPDNEICQRCEYNIAVTILKEVLKENDYCTLCKNVERIRGGFTDCKLGLDGSKGCNNYVIDYNAIIEDYQLENMIVK